MNCPKCDNWDSELEDSPLPDAYCTNKSVIDALKAIHRKCNAMLHADEFTVADVKEIRSVASSTWVAMEPIDMPVGHSEDCDCYGDVVEHDKECRNCECDFGKDAEWRTAPPPPPTRLTDGDGEYSCASCGFAMKTPCVHWTKYLEDCIDEFAESHRQEGERVAEWEGMYREQMRLKEEYKECLYESQRNLTAAEERVAELERELERWHGEIRPYNDLVDAYADSIHQQFSIFQQDRGTYEHRMDVIKSALKAHAQVAVIHMHTAESRVTELERQKSFLLNQNETLANRITELTAKVEDLEDKLEEANNMLMAMRRGNRGFNT